MVLLLFFFKKVSKKNLGSKKPCIQQKGAMITKRFGTTDQGWNKLLCLRAEPIDFKGERDPFLSPSASPFL